MPWGAKRGGITTRRASRRSRMAAGNYRGLRRGFGGATWPTRSHRSARELQKGSKTIDYAEAVDQGHFIEKIPYIYVIFAAK
jgi:hypothetical protein